VTNGVQSGKYYAGIYIPKEFSKDLMSFTTGTITKPKIQYYINEKINAIAPKITDKGASSLQTQISDQFTKTASSTLMKVFNEVGYDIDSNLVSLTKLKTMILETNDNLDEIDGYTKQITDLKTKMPTYKEKLDKVNQFSEYLPDVDEMTKKLIALNDKMPEITKQAAIIVDLQKKIPEIENAGKQIAEIDGDFDTIATTMDQGITEAKDGLAIIKEVQTNLPAIESLANNADSLATATTTMAKQLQEALPSITSSVKVVAGAIGPAASAISTWTDQAKAMVNTDMTTENRQTIKNALTDFSSSLADQQAAVTKLATLLNQLPNAASDEKLQGFITKLNHANSLLALLQTKVDTLASQVMTLDPAQITAFLDEINTAAGEVTKVANTITTSADGISDNVSTLLTKAITALTDGQALLNKAQQVDFKSLLDNTSTTVTNAVAILEKYQKQMPAIGQEISDANTMLNGQMSTIVSAINTGADLYTNELPVLTQKLGVAADFAKNDWPGIKADLTSTLSMVNAKWPDIESAVNAANDLIVNDWPSIKEGVSKAAAAIKKGEETVNISEIIKLLKSDAAKESDFITTPVDLKTTQYYPIKNNGSASTPFYTALCLWVGALLFASVTTTTVFLEGRDKKKYSLREQFMSRGLTYIAVGLAQALIVTLGNIFLLGVDVHNPVWSVLFALLISVVFMSIVYPLVALFGTVGKGLAIIILVLSISGGGGNYPIQVSGKFFQAINPLLPFTHAVNLLRESAGGIYWANAWQYLIVLVVMGAVILVLGCVFYPMMAPRIKKLEGIFQNSKLFH
jgi:putative membrane protein